MSTSGSTAIEGAASAAAPASSDGARASSERHHANPVTAAITATPATIAGASDWRGRGSFTAPVPPGSSTTPWGVIS